MIKVHVETCRFSKPDGKFSDVIQSIQGGYSENGIYNLTIKTVEKYVNVECGYISGPDYGGEYITITPIGDDGEYMDSDDPRWYLIALVVEGLPSHYSENITPLKHEYVVSFIPVNLLHAPSRFGEVAIEFYRDAPE